MPSSSITFHGWVEDLTKPDFPTLADATHGGVNQHIHLTMQPKRPSLSDAIPIWGRLKDPAEEEYDAGSPHRMAITPKPEHGFVSIVGPIGLCCANNVGAFGAVSSGQNWDRLASAAHRWGLKLVDGADFFMLIFPDDALVLAESGIFEESF